MSDNNLTQIGDLLAEPTLEGSNLLQAEVRRRIERFGTDFVKVFFLFLIVLLILYFITRNKKY